MSGIFSGIKVIDLTKVFSGPFATRMIADYGGEVIKIENQKFYDDSRDYPPLKNEWSGYYEILNRNKRSISLNLRDPRELELLYILCKDADVFVENLTPSTKYKLKVDYQTLKKFNNKIIYASLSGLGQSSDKKYYDVIAQAESGLMTLSGESDTPMKIGPSVVDAFSGQTLAFAIASALFYREKTGLGQSIDVSMLGCAMNLLESNLIAYSVTKKNPIRTGNKDNLISPFGAYKTKDGFIVLAIGNNSLWKVFLSFLKQYTNITSEEQFSTNSLRLVNNELLTPIIEAVFTRFLTVELQKKLTTLSIPCSKVNNMSDVYKNSDNYKNGFLVKMRNKRTNNFVTSGRSIKFTRDTSKKFVLAPAIGEDNGDYGL